MKKTHLPSLFVFWGLFILFCCIWFFTLDARTLIPTDEGRYAEMAREMLLNQDWITPRLNDVKYFEKPPLQTWMNALTFYLFGVGEWQARLWTALCGFIGFIFTYQAAKKIFNPHVGYLAALVLGSSLYWITLGHMNTLDMGLSGMMTVSLCSLLIALSSPIGSNTERNYMLLCWIGMALAVLSKGLIGIVLPGAVFFLYSLITRNLTIYKRLHWGKGLTIFFLIVLPWFILVAQRNPEFLHFFFVHEHFQRFTSKIHNREGAWYYFIPLLILGILPWLGILLQTLYANIKLSFSKHTKEFNPQLLLFIWSAFIFIFFSFSGSKLQSYILPIFPALAILIALYWDQAKEYQYQITAFILLIIGVVTVILSTYNLISINMSASEFPYYQNHLPWIKSAGFTMIIGAIIALFFNYKKKSTLAASVIACAGLFSTNLIFFGHNSYGTYASGKPLVPLIQSELKPNTKLYLMYRLDHTLIFYLKRTMTMVEYPDEIKFGLEQEPHLWIPKREQFINEWKQQEHAIAITSPRIYSELQQIQLPMRVINADAKRVIIANY